MKASLNHIFRTIWSEALNTWVAVSELTPAKGKSRSCVLNAAALAENDSESGNIAKSKTRLRLKPLIFALACSFTLQAQANPTGAQVVSGTANIKQSGNLLTVYNSPNAIINWQGFSIGAGQTTNFIQQTASSSVLNRVMGPDPSTLLGTLTSNGKVYLINPAGILVGQGARIDVGSFISSTLNLSNADFLAGNLNFTANASAGTIQNQGTITTPEGGSVYLVAPQIENYGVINTPKGETILAAGNTVQLMDTGTPGVSVQITGSGNTATNLGQILADSGQIGVVGAVVKNSGTLSANSLVSQGGKIFLKATNSVEAGGTISAEGATGGGTISVLADMQTGTVNVTGTLDASVPLPSPSVVTTANGGQIETSAAHVTIADTAHITTAAANGLTGSWLIDPHDFSIAATNGDITGTLLGNELATNNITILSSSGAVVTNGNGNINVNDTVSWSANTLTLTAANNININSVMNATGTASLTLNPATANGADTALATGTVLVGMNGSGFTGAVNFSGTGTLTISGNAFTVINSISELQGISTTANYALGSNLDDASAAFTPIGGNNTGNYFSGTFDGLGHTISNLNINLPTSDSVGLFGEIYSPSTVRNIGLVNASVNAFSNVGALIGNMAVGGTVTNTFATGNVSAPSNSPYSVGGLVGYGSSTSAINNSFAAVNVTGPVNVGGLVGSAWGGLISNSYATGNVTGNGSSGHDIGGLVGFNNFGGTITNSYATGSVTGGASNGTGGLVGVNAGATIANSYATGAVSGTGQYLGGLVGENYTATIGYPASISNSFATGIVTGTGAGALDIGGLVGLNEGVINNAYSTGPVSGYVNVGSLVGLNESVISTYSSIATVSNVYALGNANGTAVTTLGTVFGSDTSGNTSNAVAGFPTLTPVTWTGSASNQWTDTASWSGGVVPTIFNTATFTGTSTINIPGNVLVGNVDTTGATSTTLNFTGSNVNSLTVGNTSAVTLNATVNYNNNGKINLSVAPTFNYNGTSYSVINSSSSLLADVNTTGDYVLGSNINGGTINATTYFNGIFDGLGHAITGLSVSYPSYPVDLGLFGNVASSSASIIRNLGLVNETLTGNTYIGGLVGYNNGGAISNCYVNTLSISTIYALSSQPEYIGGLVGDNIGGAISNSFATGTLTSGYGSYYVGGLVGYNTGSINSSYAAINLNLGSFTTVNVGGLVGVNSGSINASYAIGNVTGSAANSTVGGLVGANGGTINGSNASGSVTGSSSNSTVGGLAGTNAGTINSSYATGSVTGASDIGGLVGYNSVTINSSYATGGVTGTTYVGGLVGDNLGTINNSYATAIGGVTGGNYVGGLVGGNSSTGTLSNSFYDAEKVLINGYTFSHSGGNQPGILTPGGIFDTQYLSWASSGEVLNITNYFSTLPLGTGGYYNISSIQGLEDMLGFAENSASLFRLTGNVSLTSNPGLYVTYFSGKLDGNSFAISNLVANISINSNIGLFGQLQGGTVTNLSVVNPTVNGISNVAGLVGINNGGTVTGNTVSAGTVSGGSNVGGLAGENIGVIAGSNVTSNTTVTATGGYVGGLVGYNYGTIAGSSVSGGTVASSANYVGGLVGENYTGGAISSSNVTAVTVTGGTNYTGGMVGYNSGSVTGGAVAGGSVSGAANVGGLAGYNVSSISGGTVSGGAVTGTTDAGGLVGYNTGSISSSTVTGATTVTATGSYVGGLVAYNYGGTISGSSVTNGSVSGTSYVAGLVGESIYNPGDSIPYPSSISGSSVTNVTVIATGSFVGGLVGFNSGGTGTSQAATIANSSFTGGSVTGSPTASSYVGGLVGLNGGAIVSGTAGNAPFNTISNSYATGNVSGYQYVGGLIGGNYGSVSNSYATGNVNGSANFVGGLVGTNGPTNSAANTSSIVNSYSTGAVTGVTFVGGLAGDNDGTISNSYASGSLSGSGEVGGLLGANGSNASVSFTYATGNVTGTGALGGLVAVGWNYAPITNSYWDTQTTGQTLSGGGAGLTTAAMMSGASFSSWDFTNTWGIGTGSYPYLIWRFPTAPQVVSGTLSGTGNSGATIQTAQNGSLFTTATTGANGFYYELLDAGSIPSGNALLVYLVNSGGAPAAAVRLSDGTSLAGVNLTSNILTVSSNSAAALSNSLLATAVGSLTSADIPFSVSGTNLTVSSGVAFQTATNTNYTLDGNVTTTAAGQTWNGLVTMSANAALTAITSGSISGNIALTNGVVGTSYNLTLNSAGSVTQGGPISVAGLDLLGVGGNYTLTNPGNVIATVAGNTGPVSLVDSTALTVGTVNSTVGLKPNSNITLSSAGTLTVASAMVAAPANNATLTLTANNDIDINAAIESAGNPISVTLKADQLNSGTGNVNINSSIITNNANILINGGNTVTVSSTGYLDTGNTIGSAGVPSTSVSITLPSPTSVINIANNGTNNLISGGNLTLNAGTINLNGYITAASTATANLTAGVGGIIEGTGGSLTANSLTTISTGGTTLTSANAVASFAATDTGAVSLTNTAATLSLGAISSTGLTVNNSGALAVNGAIAEGSSAVSLTASDAITETGSITAGALTTSSAGGATLTGANAVSGFSASNNTSGDIALTNTAANLTVSGTGVSNTAGAVNITNTGSLNITDAQINSSGNMNLQVGGNLNLTAATTYAQLQAGGTQLINFTGSGVAHQLSVLGGNNSSYSNASAYIHSTGLQTISYDTTGGSTLAIQVIGGSAVNNSITDYQYVNNAQTANIICSTCATFSWANIQSDGGQAITASTITLKGGAGTNSAVAGNGNFAEIQNTSTSVSQSIVTTGAISLTGGTGPGFYNSTYSSDSLTNEANIHSDGVQLITAGSLSLTGGGDANTLGGAFLTGKLGQTIATTAGGLSMVGGLSNSTGQYGIGAPAVIGEQNAETINIALVGGNLTMTGGSGLTSQALIGAAQGAPGITITAANISMNAGTGADSQIGVLTVGSAGTLLMTSTAGNILEDATSKINTASLTALSTGGINLNGANAVGSLNAKNTGGGGISLTNTAPLTITGIVNVGGGTVNVNNTGSITTSGLITSDSNINIAAIGNATDDVTISNGIFYTGTANSATLAIEANRNVIVQNVPIETTGTQALNVILDSAYHYNSATGTGTGAVGVLSGGNILSNGGNITIGGGSGTITAGNGFAQGYNGVFLDGSASGNGVDVRGNLTAAGGNIIINGNADTSGNAFNPIGISIGGITSSGTLFGGIVSTTGSGKITLTGESLSPANSPYGVGMGNAGTGETQLSGSVTTQNGDMVINAISGNTNSHGNIGLVFLNNSIVQSTGSGNITLNGTAASTAPTTLGGGIDLQAGLLGNPSVLASSGNILISSQNGTGINLSSTTISSATGDVTLDAVGGGAINQTSGSITAAGLRVLGDASTTANLTSVLNHAAIVAGNLAGNASALSYTDAGSFNLGSLTTNDGTGNTSTTSGITIGTANTLANSVTLTAGGAIGSVLTSGYDMSAGAVQLTAYSGIGSSSAPLKLVTGNLNATTTSGGVDLINIPTGAVTLVSLKTGDNSAITYSQNGGALTLAGLISSNGGAITIDPPTSLTMNPSAAITSNNGAIAVAASGNITLSSVNAGSGAISLAATNGGSISAVTPVPAGPNLVGGSATISAGSGASFSTSISAANLNMANVAGGVSITDASGILILGTDATLSSVPGLINSTTNPTLLNQNVVNIQVFINPTVTGDSYIQALLNATQPTIGNTSGTFGGCSETGLGACGDSGNMNGGTGSNGNLPNTTNPNNSTGKTNAKPNKC